MTVQHRLIFGLRDIVAVTFECKREGCGVRLSMSPDANLKHDDLRKCPSCALNWLHPEMSNDIVHVSHLLVFLLNIRMARESQKEVSDGRVGLRVFFEYDDPSFPRILAPTPAAVQ